MDENFVAKEGDGRPGEQPMPILFLTSGNLASGGGAGIGRRSRTLGGVR